MWIRLDEKIRFKRFSLAGTAGQCLMEPPLPKNVLIPTTIDNLGGILLNVITSCIALGLYFGQFDNELINSMFLVFAIVGFAIALLNGVPMKLSGVSNDGYNAFT